MINLNYVRPNKGGLIGFGRLWHVKRPEFYINLIDLFWYFVAILTTKINGKNYLNIYYSKILPKHCFSFLNKYNKIKWHWVMP